jgi:CBS domain-containing protein
MLKARDIMTKNVITVQEDTPIDKAVELLAEMDITGMPVVDKNKRLLGIITEQDVMHLFHDESSLLYGNPEEQDKKVSDFMSTPVIFFDENESVMDVCLCLKNYHFRRVPVTSEGKVIGLISRQDIIKYVLQKRREETAVEEKALNT